MGVCSARDASPSCFNEVEACAGDKVSRPGGATPAPSALETATQPSSSSNQVGMPCASLQFLPSQPLHRAPSQPHCHYALLTMSCGSPRLSWPSRARLSGSPCHCSSSAGHQASGAGGVNLQFAQLGMVIDHLPLSQHHSKCSQWQRARIHASFTWHGGNPPPLLGAALATASGRPLRKQAAQLFTCRGMLQCKEACRYTAPTALRARPFITSTPHTCST